MREAEQELLERLDLLLGEAISTEVIEEASITRLADEREHLLRAEHRAEHGADLVARDPDRLQDRREIIDLRSEPVLPYLEERSRGAHLHLARAVLVGDDGEEYLLGELGVDRMPDLEEDALPELVRPGGELEGVPERLEQVDLGDEVRLPEDRLGRDVQVEIIVGDLAEGVDERLAGAPSPRVPGSAERLALADELGGAREALEVSAEHGLLLGAPSPYSFERRRDDGRLARVKEGAVGR